MQTLFGRVLRLPRSTRALFSTMAPTVSRPIVLCGPSGAGKSTLIKKLQDEFPGQYNFSVSHTTRTPRPGEVNGKAYHFVTKPAFEELVNQAGFVEFTTSYDTYPHLRSSSTRQDSSNLPLATTPSQSLLASYPNAPTHCIGSYGTSLRAIKEASTEGATCLLDIDTVGVANVKKYHGALGCLFVFISPPSLSSLGDRLRKRGTENEATIVKRLAKAKSEIEYAATGEFDVIVVNDDVDRAYSLLRSIIRDGNRTGDKLPDGILEETAVSMN
ncbi:unnamed protein product [Rhizoctonia solani]|uniref:Guanylate kinase-like domain-containing protein n=1 Tax=Rhizoctonia solani TaxID=456999 RepID=A0A8H3GBX5_9AGAM|nr:unnamed protein product [Rhizoctonia solani]